MIREDLYVKVRACPEKPLLQEKMNASRHATPVNHVIKVHVEGILKKICEVLSRFLTIDRANGRSHELSRFVATPHDEEYERGQKFVGVTWRKWTWNKESKSRFLPHDVVQNVTNEGISHNYGNVPIAICRLVILDFMNH